MFRKSNNPIARRNLILYAGIALLTMSIICEPSLLWFFLSKNGIFEMFLLGFTSLFMAMAFYELANQILKNNGMPWYVRPRGLLVLIVLVTSFFLADYLFNNVISPFFGMAPSILKKAMVYKFFGMTFLWIVFLEKINCK